MANILCLETATTNCSVALSVDGSVIALKEHNETAYSHAELLHVFIEEVLSASDLKKEDLDAIAVSKGPGSYTGLRIGVSAAKGLCFSLDIPLISIPTLTSLALRAKRNTEYVVAMLDARRMEVYAAVFQGGSMIRKTEAEILSPTSFLAFLDQGTVTFIGSGVEKFKEICIHKNAVFSLNEYPSAKKMAQQAEDKYNKSDIEDVAYFEPYYLKEFILT